MIKAAIADPNPVIVLENELMYGQEFDMSDEALSSDFIVPIGKAKIEREGPLCCFENEVTWNIGSDVTLVAHSIAVGFAVQAADILAKEGINCEVINLRSLRPMDTESIVNSVKKTNRYLSTQRSFFTALVLSQSRAVGHNVE